MNENQEQRTKEPIVIKGWKAVVTLISIVVVVIGVFAAFSFLDHKTAESETTMPILTDKNIPQALQILKNDKFTNHEKVVFNAEETALILTEREWDVCSQIPYAYEPVKRGTEIKLVVSKDCSKISETTPLKTIKLKNQEKSGVSIKLK